MNNRDYEYTFADWKILLKEAFFRTLADHVVTAIYSRVPDPLTAFKIVVKFTHDKRIERMAEDIAILSEKGSKRFMLRLVKVMEEVLGKEF